MQNIEFEDFNFTFNDKDNVELIIAQQNLKHVTNLNDKKKVSKIKFSNTINSLDNIIYVDNFLNLREISNINNSYLMLVISDCLSLKTISVHHIVLNNLRMFKTEISINNNVFKFNNTWIKDDNYRQIIKITKSNSAFNFINTEYDNDFELDIIFIYDFIIGFRNYIIEHPDTKVKLNIIANNSFIPEIMKSYEKYINKITLIHPSKTELLSTLAVYKNISDLYIDRDEDGIYDFDNIIIKDFPYLKTVQIKSKNNKRYQFDNLPMIKSILIQ